MTDEATNDTVLDIVDEHMAAEGVPQSYSIRCDGDVRMQPARDDDEAIRIADAIFPGKVGGSWVKSAGKLCFVLTWTVS